MEKPAISIASHAEGVSIVHQLSALLCEYAYSLDLFLEDFEPIGIWQGLQGCPRLSHRIANVLLGWGVFINALKPPMEMFSCID